MTEAQSSTDRLSRARGCLLGQLAGDALGGQVEFMDAAQIAFEYPDGVRKLVDGGRWHTVAGQPTDDSELALMLARSLVAMRTYDRTLVGEAYIHWYESAPFDIGNTIEWALGAMSRSSSWKEPASAPTERSTRSQANGALMRISPLGIFGHAVPIETLVRWARIDADLTHPNAVCLDANAVYVVAIARAVREGGSPESIYASTSEWAKRAGVHEDVLEDSEQAVVRPPDDYEGNMGWVRVAFQNSFYRLLHSKSFEAGVVDTVDCGGDTDTNAAIAGALLGAVYGIDAVPTQWKEAVLSCRPQRGAPGVRRPRPTEFWPIDAMELAEQLLSLGSARSTQGDLK